MCPDAPDEGGRCENCPLDKLDAAQQSEAGMLLRRAVDLRAALKLGLRISLVDVTAEEFWALSALEEERDRIDREQLGTNGPK